MALSHIPSTPGSYGLFFYLPQSISLEIGRLGYHKMESGHYGYFGSAHGKGGLRARINHHLNSRSSPHWHLDYLRPHVEFTLCFYLTGHENMECAWSSAFQMLPFISIPVPGFGSSDCKSHCPAHLIYMESNTSLQKIRRQIQTTVNEKVFVIIITPQNCY